MAVPRVAKAPQADCCVAQFVASPSVLRPVVQAPMTHSLSWSPQVDAQFSAARPNYILQDKEDDDPPPRATNHKVSSTEHNAGSHVGMCQHLPPGVHPLRRPWPSQLHFESNQAQSKILTVMPQQMSMRRLPMTWFCEMANSVIGEGGKLLKYK